MLIDFLFVLLRDERELSFKCSRLTLLSILRSWPGILHFCSPNDKSGLKAIVDVLYLEQLEVRVRIHHLKIVFSKK